MLSTVVLVHSLPSWCSELLQLMPSSHHLLSSLYQHQLRTTIPAKIWNTDPGALQVHEQIATHSDTFRSHADKHCKSLAPLYAGQPVAMYNTLYKIWVLATVVCVLPKESYQACTSNGSVYHHTRWHLHEHSFKPADTVPDATTTTPQALARPHLFVPQPAPTKPAQSVEPTLVTPTMPATPKPQATAVPTTPAVP